MSQYLHLTTLGEVMRYHMWTHLTSVSQICKLPDSSALQTLMGLDQILKHGWARSRQLNYIYDGLSVEYFHKW